MRRLILVAALVAAGLSSAETPQEPEETLTFTRSQLNAMEQELEAIVNRREKDAFEAGVRHQRQACASLI